MKVIFTALAAALIGLGSMHAAAQSAPSVPNHKDGNPSARSHSQTAPRPTSPPSGGAPLKRFNLCTDRPNGFYCGDSGDTRLYECTDGYISNYISCTSGCDYSANVCRRDSNRNNSSRD